jgi:hypothetical protein
MTTAGIALILMTAGTAFADNGRTADASPVTPQSASGCTGSEVCINVNGSALHVNYIDGTIYNDHTSQWCGYIGVTVYKGGTYYTADQSPYLCINGQAGGGDVTYYKDWKDSVNRDYPSGSKACAWAYTSSGTSPGGPPCETIG